MNAVSVESVWWIENLLSVRDIWHTDCYENCISTVSRPYMWLETLKWQPVKSTHLQYKYKKPVFRDVLEKKWNYSGYDLKKYPKGRVANKLIRSILYSRDWFQNHWSSFYPCFFAKILKSIEFSIVWNKCPYPGKPVWLVATKILMYFRNWQKISSSVPTRRVCKMLREQR